MTTTRETADHAELARMAAKLRETKYRWTMGYRDDVLLNPDGPKAADALENLLSEIAALRGERDHNWPAVERLDLETRLVEQAGRATQAERQRDELRKALEGALPQLEVLHSILSSKETRAVVWREITKGRQALASQGADPTPVKKERAWICPQDNTPCPPECDSDDRRHCASVACNEQPE